MYLLNIFLFANSQTTQSEHTQPHLYTESTKKFFPSNFLLEGLYEIVEKNGVFTLLLGSRISWV